MIGLINLDLLLVADNVLLIPILLALYVALRRASESLMAIATAFGLVGIVLFIVSNPAIEMLFLSNPSTRRLEFVADLPRMHNRIIARLARHAMG